MADDRTRVTELVTALGLLGLDSLDEALIVRPREMVSLSPEQWDDLAQLRDGGAYADETAVAWANGQAFFQARDGLRRRRPVVVEWRGGTRQPGDEPVPADLRVDHVYLVSCKYLSKIVSNSAPSLVFDELLVGGHGRSPGTDWYAEVAEDLYQDLYRAACGFVEGRAAEAGRPVSCSLPSHVSQLVREDRELLKQALPKRWPPELQTIAGRFSETVAAATADRWRGRLGCLNRGDRDRALWRLLRISSTPYFVLGSARDEALRLRVGTSWDWKQNFRLRDLHVEAEQRGQPVVSWQAEVTCRGARATRVVEGHVEIRWSHGKFCGPPEAKVYLDTAHADVPGYWRLE